MAQNQIIIFNVVMEPFVLIYFQKILFMNNYNHIAHYAALQIIKHFLLSTFLKNQKFCP